MNVNVLCYRLVCRDRKFIEDVKTEYALSSNVIDEVKWKYFRINQREFRKWNYNNKTQYV